MKKLSFYILHFSFALVLTETYSTFAMHTPQDKGKAPAVDKRADLQERIATTTENDDDLATIYEQLLTDLATQVEEAKKLTGTPQWTEKDEEIQSIRKLIKQCEDRGKAIGKKQSVPSDFPAFNQKPQVPKTDSSDDILKKPGIPSESMPDVRGKADKQEHELNGKKILQICLITGGLIALVAYFAHKNKQPHLPTATAA